MWSQFAIVASASQLGPVKFKCAFLVHVTSGGYRVVAWAAPPPVVSLACALCFCAQKFSLPVRRSVRRLPEHRASSLCHRCLPFSLLSAHLGSLLSVSLSSLRPASRSASSFGLEHTLSQPSSIAAHLALLLYYETANGSGSTPDSAATVNVGARATLLSASTHSARLAFVLTFTQCCSCILFTSTLFFLCFGPSSSTH